MKTDRDVAQYISDMILELRNMAKASSYNTLQGLLEIAYYEAYSVAHQVIVPEGEEDHLRMMGNDARRHEAA